MRSLQLRALDDRHRELRRQFLPRNFSKTGNYSRSQYSYMAAFRLLFHSELETYFENLASFYLDLIDAIIRSGNSCKGASALVALYRSDDMGGTPNQISEIKAKPFLLRIQLHCLQVVRTRILTNRGVKASNILSMFIPIGVDETKIDQQLIIDLNLIGARRGDVAHKGLEAITSLPDPKDDKLLAERIIQSLKEFEALLPSTLS